MMGGWINRKDWLKDYVKPREKENPAIEEGNEKQIHGVVYHILRCPRLQCRSDNILTYKSSPPVRYHRCKDCGIRFKSFEAKD